MPHRSQSRSIPNLVGQTIYDDRLLLVSKLGSGAYGQVYKAFDLRSSPPTYYAVKCLLRFEPGSKDDLAQQREFSMHAEVSDVPGVINAYTRLVDDNDSYVYVVLDLCEGGDLFKGIVQRRLFHRNDDLIRGTFLQLLEAMERIHERGIYHRDLKPENVLATRDCERIWISDFGLATREEESKQFGCGSPFYMSPEVWCKDKPYLTGPNDVWALGVILVNMVTGRNPWSRASLDDACFLAFIDDRDFLPSVIPISRPLNEVLKRTFDLDPKTRITIPELRKEIEKVSHFWPSKEELKNANASVLEAVSYADGQPIPVEHEDDDDEDDDILLDAQRVRIPDILLSTESASLITPDSKPVVIRVDVREDDDVPPIGLGIFTGETFEENGEHGKHILFDADAGQAPLPPVDSSEAHFIIGGGWMGKVRRMLGLGHVHGHGGVRKS